MQMSDIIIHTRRDLLLGASAATLAAGLLPAEVLAQPRGTAGFPSSMRTKALDFARAEIAAAAASGTSAPRVTFKWDASLGAEAYRIEKADDGAIVTGGDLTGAMYGGLDIAEALRLHGLDGLLADRHVRKPFVERRGIKFNIPLDLRTPSYSDGATAARRNIPEMWSHDFWAGFFDSLARHRYNVVTLWSLHPFPSMVKVPEFPDVALNDVWRSLEPLDPLPFEPRGTQSVPPKFLANHEVVKKIAINEKIAFWREVMQMAADRGIQIHVFTWNVFNYGAEGKYGIDNSMSNKTTIAYTRASVREMVKTYPLLAGFGITAGENMPRNPDITNEQWLWQTYGEGVRDGLKNQPHREVKLIHRFWLTSGDEVNRNWSQYPGFPGSFSFSYKYSQAHMYSEVKPPFVKQIIPFLKGGLRTWLTVRNDDFYALRWGDPDFARQYVLNMPPHEQLTGFYMGPDGFTWGRDFLDRDDADKELGAKRPLVIDKHWYSFMLWGRLSYDPRLPDALFEDTIKARFPDADTAVLYDAWATASKIIPQTSRFFWRTNDVEWYPEACGHYDRLRNGSTFYTVADFMNGVSMPGANILNIRQWRYRLANNLTLDMPGPLESSDALAGFADSTLALVAQLRRADPRGKELRQTLGDCESFDASAREEDRARAIAHLELALAAWKRYAAIRDAQYVPAYYCRIGYVDITARAADVARDIDIAKGWKPGTLMFDPGKPADASIGLLYIEPVAIGGK
jgi:hypothetical protein